MYRISQIASQAPNLDALWQPLFDEVLGTMNVEAGTLMFLENDLLVRKVARGLDQEVMNEPPIPASKGGISWKAVTTQKPVVINELSGIQVASKAVSSGDFHSLVTIPMMVRDQVIGVISIFAKKERVFTDDDISLFTVIANQAALAIMSLTSAELLRENKEQLSELSSLNQISQSVSTLFNFEETLFTVIVLISRQVKGSQGVLTLFDHKDKLLKAVKPAYNLLPNQIRDLRMPADEGLTGQAFCKGVPILMNEIDLATRSTLERGHLLNVKSAMAAPLKIKSQTLGVIHVFSDKTNNFDEKDLNRFSLLASQAAIVVNSSYIYREISEERNKDKALLASIGEGVLAVDIENNIILLNETGEKLTGYLEEEVIGKSADIIIDSKSRVQNVNLDHKDRSNDVRTADGKHPQLIRRDGSSFPARVTISPTKDADDKVIGAIIVFADITKELEVEQMKQELISIATHELRTPITGIKGYLDMIISGDTGGINEETKEVIEEMRGINQKLADLVDDLLNVGRIEEGRIECRPVAMDLGKLVSDIVKELSIQARQKNLELRIMNYEENKKIMVKADPDRARQILINLIGNAIKYTPSGSVTISIENSSQRSSNNKIYSSSGGEKFNQVIIHVKDTGLGISKESQKQLFQKFYRVKTDKTRSITGTGLGLWITKQIVEMMNGKIWLESEEGKGSTFSFSLPTAE